jgi:hypothetical protein
MFIVAQVFFVSVICLSQAPKILYQDDNDCRITTILKVETDFITSIVTKTRCDTGDNVCGDLRGRLYH